MESMPHGLTSPASKRSQFRRREDASGRWYARRLDFMHGATTELHNATVELFGLDFVGAVSGTRIVQFSVGEPESDRPRPK